MISIAPLYEQTPITHQVSLERIRVGEGALSRFISFHLHRNKAKLALYIHTSGQHHPTEHFDSAYKSC